MNKPCSQSSFETSCSDDDDNEILTNDLCMHRSITFRGRYMFATMLVLILGAFGTTTFQQYAADSQKSNIMRSSETLMSSFTSLELTDDGKVTWTTRPSPPAGSLLDPVIEAFRQGMTIDAASIAIHAPRASSDCSCFNSTTATSPDPCCGRFYIRGHKMGIQLVSLLFPTFHFDNRYVPLNAKHYVDSDLRVAVVLRNVYEAIVSGYLYHKQGRECYTDPNGLPLRDKETHQPRVGNTDFVKYTTFLNDTTAAATGSNLTIIAGNLCQFIMDEPVERGMRAYIDFVFRGDYYKSSLLVWRALSQHVGWIGDRTHVACYEDLMTNRTATLYELLHFYHPSGVPPAMAAKVASGTSKLASRSNATYSGPHATNHDADLRASLVNVVKALDSEFYHGQIAHVDSMIPCGK
ncbi:hypothetical protein MPSEU_000421600 [Mayamaea pseudoterrestris]|nr:hypothetical protein MPSEU_000421600 [Mayamaea pseudoterrestris]